MSTHDSLVLRTYGAEDEDEARALIGAVLPGNPKADAAVMRWQYDDSPYGRASRWVWEDDGRIVGHYAAYHVPVVIGGKPARGCVGVDAAIASTHQGRGLFSRIIDAAQDEQRRTGVSIVYFFPGSMSQLPSRSRSLGWPFRTYVLGLRSGWLAQRMRVPRPAARVLSTFAFRAPRPRGATTVDGVPVGIDDLWTEVAERLPFGTVKDGTWWAWRYGAHPHSPYRFAEVRDGGRLRGAAATVRREVSGATVVYILDVLAANDAAARAVVGAVVEDARSDADAVALSALPGSVPARCARAAGMLGVPHRWEANPLWLAVFDVTEDQQDDLVGPWSATWGDMDHL